MGSSFRDVLEIYRKSAFSERDKGSRFEILMQGYLRTDPMYAHLTEVWLWNEFPYRDQFSGKDTGIDLVARTDQDEYWAIQCKCYQETTCINKAEVDTFLSTSGKMFVDDQGKKIQFSERYWIATTDLWGSEAEKAIENQTPPVNRIGLSYLESAPVQWDKLHKGIFGRESRLPKKVLRPHQQDAVQKFAEHFQRAERGRLIMACGTGKTFTSLKIAEKETQGHGFILFLVPSIALLGQTLREWSAEAENPLQALCICSDAEVSKRKSKAEDDASGHVEDLAMPATTNAIMIKQRLKDVRNQKHKESKENEENNENKKPGLTVVFCTYQSIERVSDAQKDLIQEWQNEHPNGDNPYIFDLIICDEAHRTTGASLKNKAGEYDESAFVRVHDGSFLQSQRRLYMTATPRLYDPDAKEKAKENEAILCSMDDPKIYGQEVYRIGFGEAVKRGLLSDYKVMILTIGEQHISSQMQQAIADSEKHIHVDDFSKLIGCINALSKRMDFDSNVLREEDPTPIRRAVAFCQSIKVSEKITEIFNGEVTPEELRTKGKKPPVSTDGVHLRYREAYYESLTEEARSELVQVRSQHIDGTMGSCQRDDKLNWLKSTPDNENECRILTNVRCLSEGVDVPSLDAVLFLSERNSQIDVVQSVGRVMRKSPGKKFGYIIIPVVIPTNEDPKKVMDDSSRFRVIWSVLNALRSHDERFDAIVNRIDLNQGDSGGTILVGDPSSDEKAKSEAEKEARERLRQKMFDFSKMRDAFYAKLVKKVGTSDYWTQWASDIAIIAQRHIERIRRKVNESAETRGEFEKFLGGLRGNINPSVDEDSAVEMLAQHLITKPVFEALFEGYSFVQNNAVSKSMQQMVSVLDRDIPAEDLERLEKFYQSVRERASGINNAQGRQELIIRLYNDFFRCAFPKMVEQLGIVYTPVEVVDFIIQSVVGVLQKEFNRSISDENIHILDPFTGTGTFITRLLQSGVIDRKSLERKYKKEIHANEIVLLAYYIAAVNIESAYHDLLVSARPQILGGKAPAAIAYEPFDGICLTDTFQLTEKEQGKISGFPENIARIRSQRKLPIKIILGNPPYSMGQRTANDNAQNQSYPRLENRIAETYAIGSQATSVKALYDAYIKAFRWATDRLNECDNRREGGIVAFVTNGQWLDANGMDGFRKSLEREFSSIYVFNLRGNARTQGEIRKKEAGNVFDSGSRTPVAITILVRKPLLSGEVETDRKATIYYHDIGDYLTREKKLKKLTEFQGVTNPAFPSGILTPNEHGDWINQRNDTFSTFVPLAPEKKFSGVEENCFFGGYSCGIVTARDSWCYNSSNSVVRYNMRRTIDFYNEQVKAYIIAKGKSPDLSAEEFINRDSRRFSWDRPNRFDVERSRYYEFSESHVIRSMYRPFFVQWLYFSRELSSCVYQLPKLFPTPHHTNLVIGVPGNGGKRFFSTMIYDSVPDFNGLEAGAQCFPLYWYEEAVEKKGKSVQPHFPAMQQESESDKQYIRHDGVTDYIGNLAKQKYGDASITKRDIFDYVYGVLHSKEYRETFAADLKKMLPRIPLVDSVDDFRAFSTSGRKLAELHLNYETVPPCAEVKVIGDDRVPYGAAGPFTEDDYDYYRVEKLRFPKKDQKDTLIYNSHIRIENIPPAAYDYVVNGRSGIEWLMDRYQVSTHEKSQIVNDPNDWSREHEKPRYILDLILSVIQLSLETNTMVDHLPKMKFDI